ncbi:hypothetical protein BDY24DRAFT_393333 [Mrakia frigida]|uniref:uncharacterized protein n=1 Tax=Mrakia frigida TaxID=29902 RepID=UPI003FCC0F2B
MSTFAISHIPILRPRVEELLSSSSTLFSVAKDVLSLVPSELAFSLVLETALPVLMDLSRPASRRMAALFVVASLQGNSTTPELDPFRSCYMALLSRDTQGDAHLEDWEKDDVDVDEKVLDWALWYILAGLKDKLSIYTSEQLTTSPFPLPIESFFGQPTSNSATASDFRAAPRSRETSPTRNTLAQLIRLTYLAKERALSSKEERLVPSLLPPHTSLLPLLFPPSDLPTTTQHNPDLSSLLLLHLHTHQPDHRVFYLDALSTLPPTLPSLDLISKLLREPPKSNGEEEDVSLAEVVRYDVLGRFFGGVVDQLDGLELRKKLQGEQEGGTRVEEELARGVSIACRFITSLLSSKTISRDDGVSVEATSFTLRFSRFSQAQMLYRTLVGSSEGSDAV